MSDILISAALEKKLAAIASPLATAYENQVFTPTPGTAYQRVNLIPNSPVDHAITADLVERRGLFQITVCYPYGSGRGAAQTKAKAIADHFAPVQDLIEGGVTVVIDKTTRIGSGQVDGDRWTIPITVQWRTFSA